MVIKIEFCILQIGSEFLSLFLFFLYFLQIGSFYCKWISDGFIIRYIFNHYSNDIFLGYGVLDFLDFGFFGVAGHYVVSIGYRMGDIGRRVNRAVRQVCTKHAHLERYEA